MKTLWKMMRMETLLFFREKQAVFWTFLFPVLMIWLFGSMFGDEKIGGMSFSNAYVPSWIAVNLLTTALFSLGTTMVNYRETGVLRRYQVTPVRPWVIITAQTVCGTVIFLISAAILVLFGWLAFDLTMPKYLGSTLLAMGLSILAIFPFGLFVTSLAKNARTAAAISSLVLNLMLFLSGATFPLEAMPKFLQMVAKGLPLYYVIDLMRDTWNWNPISENALNVGVLTGIFVVSTILATRLFRWDVQ